MDTMTLIFGEAVRCKEQGVATNTWSIRQQILQALRHVRRGMTEKEMVDRLFAEREDRGATIIDPGEPGNSIAWLLAQGAIAHDAVTGRWYTEVTPHRRTAVGTSSSFVVARGLVRMVSGRNDDVKEAAPKRTTPPSASDMLLLKRCEAWIGLALQAFEGDPGPSENVGKQLHADILDVVGLSPKPGPGGTLLDDGKPEVR